jgi:tRNA dimethylallyltransferase
MQMYDGLRIITNKITVEEQKGIPHHLLGVVKLHEQPWQVGTFKQKAEGIIESIRSRRRLPILVGGTHYYTQSLLFDDALVAQPADEGEGAELSRTELNQKYPILDAPTEEILEKLREVDPVMAERWHPNDRRKIQRSLEIYLTTGRQASKVYEEQRERKEARTGSNSVDVLDETAGRSLVHSAIVFWVHAESEVLKTRLDARVDKMMQRGLLEEVKSLDRFITERDSASTIDMTSGIWVSIGYKEFAPYLKALKDPGTTDADLQTLLEAAVEQTKAATRQYAKRQIRWIRLKLLAALNREQALSNIYLLDGTDLEKWSQTVLDPATDITGRLLAHESLPRNAELSDAARECLAPKQDSEFCGNPELWVRHTCDVCNTVVVTENQWQDHLKSRSHRRNVKKAKSSTDRRYPQRMDTDQPA